MTIEILALRCAEQMADTKQSLFFVARQTLGRPPSSDEMIDLEAAMLSKQGLFRCACCEHWLPITRIDPANEKLCLACAESP